jgi:hypothetical protein
MPLVKKDHRLKPLKLGAARDVCLLGPGAVAGKTMEYVFIHESVT